MKPSRLGLIGNVHAEAERLEAALAFLRQEEVDAVLCSGDVVDGVGDVNRCCELLWEAGVATVRGNHDRWLLENQMRQLPEATRIGMLSENSRQFIASLPPTRSFETIVGRLLLCHGVGENDMRRLMPYDDGYALEANAELQPLIQGSEFRVVVGGHTHRRMARQFGAMMFINVGTLYRSHDPCIAILDFATHAVQFFNFAGSHLEAPSERFELTQS